MKTLGIDIGGSALKGAPVDLATGTLLAERIRIPTPEPLTPRATAAAVAQLAAEFKWRGPIGVGFPGVVERGGARISTAANMHPRFVGVDAVKLFSTAVGRPVAVLNDAAAAGLAEMEYGAGRGFGGKTLMLTLGTGVGSVLAYRGQVVPLELGHLPWKGEKSAEKFVAASVREDRGLAWDEWGARLSEYIQVLERIIWPELIIIGGGVSAKHRKFFKYLDCRARIVPAKLLNRAGIVGAALWAARAR